MNILEEIIKYKTREVEQMQQNVPLDNLIKSRYFNRKTFSLKKTLSSKNGIISEFKRQSPSKGIINNTAQVKEVVTSYQKAGVSAVSILTDEYFFGGNMEDILQVREELSIPILRKDFIISNYQIYQSKAIGADVILLIASVLSREQIKEYSTLAQELGLEVLLELHDKEEMDKIVPQVQHVGVNNRDLKTFSVDINLSKEILPLIPENFSRISESGISEIDTILELKKLDVNGFLIGENFMSQKNPGEACIAFCKELSEKEENEQRIKN